MAVSGTLSRFPDGDRLGPESCDDDSGIRNRNPDLGAEISEIFELPRRSKNIFIEYAPC